MTLRILVDQDGPLAGFDRKFFAECDRNGWHLDCTLDGQRHRFATDHVIDREHRKAARDLVDSTRWFLDLPVVEGAVEGLDRLAEIADVWIVTKPLEANPWCRDDKAAWVRRHFGTDWEHRLVITPDKSIVSGDILLDDAPKLDWLPNAEWNPVIYSTPWNGAGSKWAGLPHWSWDRPLVELIGHDGVVLPPGWDLVDLWGSL